MLRKKSQFLLLVLSLTLVTGHAVADNKPKAPNKHILTWDAFARNTLALQQKLVGEMQVEKKTRIGGYAGMPDFYIEHTYFAAGTERLISRVQWEKAHPDKLHTIEVYLYDDKGRVVRDFTAAYLPNYYTVPTQTLISLHGYHDDLHAFRTFDASGYRIVERCTGQFQGQEVNLLLDEDEIADGTPEMQSEVYKRCFEGLPLKAGKYLTPQ